MAFDGIVAKSILRELTPLIGGKIDKIHEPDRNTILLGIYSQGKTQGNGSFSFFKFCLKEKNSLPLPSNKKQLILYYKQKRMP